MTVVSLSPAEFAATKSALMSPPPAEKKAKPATMLSIGAVTLALENSLASSA